MRSGRGWSGCSIRPSFGRLGPALGKVFQALTESGIEHTVTRHGRVGSLAEAAAERGVHPSAIVKTMVVRRGEGDHLFVLVPGGACLLTVAVLAAVTPRTR